MTQPAVAHNRRYDDQPPTSWPGWIGRIIEKQGIAASMLAVLCVVVYLNWSDLHDTRVAHVEALGAISTKVDAVDRQLSTHILDERQLLVNQRTLIELQNEMVRVLVIQCVQAAGGISTSAAKECIGPEDYADLVRRRKGW